MAWVKGPSADYDDWADLVDDPWWCWDNVKQVLNKVGLNFTSYPCRFADKEPKSSLKAFDLSVQREWESMQLQRLALTGRMGED